MSDLVRSFVQTWESELLLLRPNDPLIHLSQDNFIEDPEELWAQQTKSKQILKELKRIERERGVIALTRFEGLLSWQKGNKTIQTPLFLFQCNAILNQSKEIILEEGQILNPYLSFLLKKNEIRIDEKLVPSKYIEALLKCGLFYSYEAKIGFANLHPQRYELRKEWEALQLQKEFAPTLHQIVGDSDIKNDHEKSTWDLCQISPLDPDQIAAVDHAGKNSIVIYGPPGTGKSVVLSNIISSALNDGQRVLVIADKAVALSVLQGKLKALGLDQFCMSIHDQKSRKHFFEKLQIQFEYLLQSPTSKFEIKQSKHFRGESFWKEKKRLEAISGLSLETLLKYFKHQANPSTHANKRWINWIGAQDQIKSISKPLAALLPYLNSSWQKNSVKESLAQWQLWEDLWQQFKENDILTLDALNDYVEKSLRCFQFKANVYEQYTPLLDSDVTNHLKKLLKYQQVKQEQLLLEQKLKVWQKIPTLEEWVILKTAAGQTNFLQKIKWRKLAKTWLRTWNVALMDLEKDLFCYWRNCEKLSQIAQQMTKLGVLNIELEIGVIISLLKQHKSEDWAWYRSQEKNRIALYCSLHQRAHQFQQLHLSLFNANAQAFEDIQKKVKNGQNDLVDQFELMQSIAFDLWRLIDNPQIHLEEISREFWADIRINYPSVFNEKTEQSKSAIEWDLNHEERIWLENAQHLIAKQHARFHELQSLLEKPLNKLNSEQKLQRQTLRKGKAILIKEMAKTRSHITIHELFQGPAKEWLRVIFPIWMSSPTALADAFPLQKAIFDIGIFDEASQLPLSHAVGALQRVKKLVVAGDPQQMRPQSYFGQSSEGVVDLLHQAAYHLPRCHLHYHYRSEDATLIAFSNAHFYQNKLLVWPSIKHSKNGVFDHFIEDGVYYEQQNLREAKAIAKHLSNLLSNKESIGVVAFSEIQLTCIYQQLRGSDQLKLEQRITDKSAFFLPLEQVQGEECDILLISFGFAKNEQGNFSLKLGPMVQSQSGRRLNVLLTRAKRALHFYSSIRARDFPEKRSSATQRIWEWFMFLEKDHNDLKLYNANAHLDSASNYSTFLNFYRVLKQRGAL